MKKILEATLRFGNTNLLKNYSVEELNSINSDGTSVLMYAIKNCSYKICEYLVNNGVDIYYKSNSNETALTLAKELKKDPIVNLILNKINQDKYPSEVPSKIKEKNYHPNDNIEPIFFDYIDDVEIDQDTSIIDETITTNKEIYSSVPVDNSLDLNIDLHLETNEYYKNIFLNESEYYLSKQIVQKILNNAIANNGITERRINESLFKLKYTKKIKSSLIRVLEEHNLVTEDPFFDEATSFYFFEQITYQEQVDQLYEEYLDYLDKWHNKDFLAKYQKKLKTISHEETINFAKKRDHFLWDLYLIFKSKALSLKDTLLNSLPEKEHKNIENLFVLLEKMPNYFDVSYLYQITDKENFGLGSIIKYQNVFSDFFKKSTLYTNYEVLINDIKETLYKITAGNWKLITNYVAKKAKKFPLFYEDLFFAGEKGLQKAAAMYKLNKEIRFSTYATFWIKAETGAFLKNNEFQIRIPVHVYDSLTSTEDQYNFLDWQCVNIEYQSFCPIYSILNYEKCNKTYSFPLPLVQINFSNCIFEIEKQFCDFFTYENDTYEEIHQREVNKALYDCIFSKRFTDKERYILFSRFGLRNYPEKTLEEIGKEVSLTRERVRQITEKVLEKLKVSLNNKI